MKIIDFRTEIINNISILFPTGRVYIPLQLKSTFQQIELLINLEDITSFYDINDKEFAVEFLIKDYSMIGSLLNPYDPEERLLEFKNEIRNLIEDNYNCGDTIYFPVTFFGKKFEIEYCKSLYMANFRIDKNILLCDDLFDNESLSINYNNILQKEDRDPEKIELVKLENLVKSKFSNDILFSYISQLKY